MRSNMMFFTLAASTIFGLWFTLAPSSYLTVMMLPAEGVTRLTPFLLGHAGIAILVVAFWLYVVRGLTTSENTERMMTNHAIGWFLFGIGGLFVVWRYGDFTASNMFVWQSVLFLVFSGFFFAMRARAD